MSPGQTGHITGRMGRVPGTDGTHTRGCPAEILYVYWFFSFPVFGAFAGGKYYQYRFLPVLGPDASAPELVRNVFPKY